MNGTTTPTVFTSGNVFEQTTDQRAELGSLLFTRDGRVFRYVKAGALLVVGNVLQAPAQVTTHDQLTPAAAALGALTLVPTLDGTNNAAAQQYANGWACIDTTPGLGYMYPIASHPAAALSTACSLTLPSDAPVQVALTTDSRITLTPCPWKNIIQAPATTLTGAVVGVAVAPIASASFGWIQVAGPAGVLITGTPAVGALVVSPSGTAGAAAVDPADAAVGAVGRMMVTGVSGKVLPVMLSGLL